MHKDSIVWHTELHITHVAMLHTNKRSTHVAHVDTCRQHVRYLHVHVCALCIKVVLCGTQEIGYRMGKPLGFLISIPLPVFLF